MELVKNNNSDEVINILILMIFYIQIVIKNPDQIIIESIENKTIYEKVYDGKNNLSIRVITEIKVNRIEIKSLHFIKTKIPP